MELAGKVAIVTGAAGNLGSACASEMAKQGAKIVLTDLPGTTLGAVTAAINKDGGAAVAQEGDISLEATAARLVEVAQRSFGRLDILVNVAAALRQVQSDRDLEGMTVDTWDHAMAVNVRGAMLCSKHAVPVMRSQGTGAIINFSSTAGLRGDVGLIAYSTTKAALLGFTRAVATTYGKAGIRCNAVCPGSAWTEAAKTHMGPQRLDLMERTRLTPRLGLPIDIANMVVFLASDKAAYVTGQTFVVDGGGTAHQPWVRMQ